MVMSELLAEWRKEAAKHTRVGNVCIQAIEVASPVLSRQTILELASVAEEEYKAATSYATRIKNEFGQPQLPGMNPIGGDTTLETFFDDGSGETVESVTFNSEEVKTVRDVARKIGESVVKIHTD